MKGECRDKQEVSQSQDVCLIEWRFFFNKEKVELTFDVIDATLGPINSEF